MRFYATAPYANYVHVHMYLVGKDFLSALKREGVSGEQYTFRVTIDGNVSVWQLNTSSPAVVKIFDKIRSKKFTAVEIKNAVSEVAKQLNCTFRLKNLDDLSNEIQKIRLVSQKPRNTDDSLTSPSLDFLTN